MFSSSDIVGDEMFNEYFRYGKIYVIFSNNGSEKYIYQPATGELMDSNSQIVTLEDIFGSREDASGFINFLRKEGEDIKESRRRRRMRK